MSICECAWGHCRSCGSDIGWQAERENGKRGGMKAQQGENRKINLEGPCRLVIKPLRPDVYLNKKAICSCCLFLFVFFSFHLIQPTTTLKGKKSFVRQKCSWAFGTDSKKNVLTVAESKVLTNLGEQFAAHCESFSRLYHLCLNWN